MTMMQMLVAGGGGLTIPLPVPGVSKAGPSPGTYTAKLRFGSDGRIYDQDGLQFGDWCRPVVAGVGAPYFLKVTLASGTNPTGTMNAWVSMATDQEYTLTSSVSLKQANLNWFIASAASDSALIAGSTATIYVESIA